MKSAIKFIFIIVFACLPACSAAFAQNNVEITSIEVSSSGAFEYVTIKTTAWDPPAHRYYRDGNKLVLTFIDTKISFLPALPATKESRIADILTISMSTSVEVIVNFKRDIRYDVANMMGRDMSVVEIWDAPAHPVEKVEEIKDQAKEEKEPVEIGVEAQPQVPAFARTGKFKVILGGHEFKAGGKNVFSGGQYMIPAKDFFQAIDAQVIEKKDGSLLILRGDAQRIEIFPGGKNVKVNGKDFALDVEPKPVKKFRKAVLYVPLVSIAKIIGYGVIWDEKGKALVINPILKAVTLSGTSPSFRIDLSFSDVMDEGSVHTLSTPKLITVEVKDAIVSADGNIVSGEASIVRKILIAQDGARKTSVTIALSSALPFREASLDHGNTYSLLFYPAIQKIKPIKHPGSTEIEITSDSAITFEAGVAKVPDRIILDFPGTILKAPLKIMPPQGTHEHITAISASQFRLDPPATRIVISLSEAPKFVARISEDSRTVSIIVPDAKTAKVPREPQKYSILKNKVIVIDAGHGGKDPGTIGYSGSYEKDATLLLALKISETLERAGATVLLSRERDTTPNLSETARLANNNKVDIFISVHYNSFPWQNVSGTETYYYTPQSRLLARVIHKNLVRGIKRKNRGIKRVMYYTIHHAAMPSVLIEPGYLTNPKEEKLAFNPAFQKEVSFDILKGVVEYFSILKNVRRK